MGGLVIGDDERPRQILHLQQKDQTNPASLFLFCLPPRLSSRNVRDEPAMKWEVDVGEESRVSLPCSGLLFLLGTVPKSPDRTARCQAAKADTGEWRGRVRNVLTVPYGSLQSREESDHRCTVCGENHDHVPVPRSVQEVLCVAGRNARDSHADDHSSLYVAGCGVKERNCVCWCPLFPIPGGGCALSSRNHVIIRIGLSHRKNVSCFIIHIHALIHFCIQKRCLN